MSSVPNEKRIRRHCKGFFLPKKNKAIKRMKSSKSSYLHMRTILFLWGEKSSTFTTLPCHGMTVPRLMQVFLKQKK